MSFFEKLGKTITNTTQSVVEKTKSSTDTIYLNGKVSDEERKINAVFLAIGKKYDELHGTQFEPEFAEYFRQLTESRQKIEEYRAQIRKNKHTMLCEKCGNEIAETAMVCNNCGAENPVGKRLAEERAAREAAERAAQQEEAARKDAAQAARAVARQQTQAALVTGEVCSNCGKPRMQGALFCTSCGTRFAPAVNPQSVPTTATPVAPETPAAPTVPVTETTTLPLESAPNLEETAQPLQDTPVFQEFAVPSFDEAPTLQTKSAERICPNCGGSVPAENLFCVKCGEKMPQGKT